MDHRVNRCTRRSRWNVCKRIIQVAEQHNPHIPKLSALPQSHANTSNDTQPPVPSLASIQFAQETAPRTVSQYMSPSRTLATAPPTPITGTECIHWTMQRPHSMRPFGPSPPTTATNG